MIEAPRRFEQNPEKLISAGRILYLTKDPQLIIDQLAGMQLDDIPDELLDNISTDAIIPNRACITWDGKQKGYLGKFLLTGIPAIHEGEIFQKFDTVVAGESFAKGSSRIHAPLAFQDAGISLIIAKSERIFRENCANLGINLVDSQKDLANVLLAGFQVPQEMLLKYLSNQEAQILRSGSLLNYLEGIEKGRIKRSEVKTTQRPMTIAEKIIARASENKFVKPGDEVIATPDIYYGYELQTNATAAALKEKFGDNIPVKNPEKGYFYGDHTALLKDENTANLRQEQSKFANALGLTVYEVDTIEGAPAICHTDMVENHALPGQLILGNDSHTCSVGVVNTLAVGKGALDLAGAIAYDKMVLTVPESIRINLNGQLPKGVYMKDFMLWLGAKPEFREDKIGSNRVLEFDGYGLNGIPFSEQYKLTNMSIELLGFTGVVQPNDELFRFLNKNREKGAVKNAVFADEDAQYFRTLEIDLAEVEQYVSEPGDTQNGKPLSEIKTQHIEIQKVYIGSCTHGTPEDLRQAAEVLNGRKIAEGVMLYVQASSRANLASAESKGYVSTLLKAGAQLLPIGCGACMNAGPGSTEEGEIGLFATNRNFPGRTGKGKTYLSSPSIAAASAITGYICGPKDI